MNNKEDWVEHWRWFRHKYDLNRKERNIFFKEREVWFSYLGINVGYEENGKGSHFLRPIIIITKFSNEVLLCVPITSKIKFGRYYYQFKRKNKGFNTAILSQVRFIDSLRLKYKSGNISDNDLREIKKRLISILKEDVI